MGPDAFSPLRRRMLEDMTIRQFGEHTQRDYVRQVREFMAFLGLSPDRAEPEDRGASISAISGDKPVRWSSHGQYSYQLRQPASCTPSRCS